ncbi:MAG: acyltransferase family protein, partial [bacterium]|nr:acyltransferase family protein [Candidatus Aphodosoma intestinipullorum]
MDQVTSKIIAGIRFPLICGIVLIHLRIMECSGVYMGNINWYIFRLFSDILGRISVPLFAIISGYLFFVNVRKYDWIAYKQKLYRRLKSILLPYVLWNLLFYLVYVIYLVSTGRLVERYTDGNLFDIVDIFLWGSTGKPIDYPLWFMRDLFLLA